jgi:AcrR family transcriptional regulator
MPKPGPRTYHSPTRQKQADETRRRIVDAARKLMLEKGFDGTTIDAVAREAGVAAQTVYAAFGSKRGIVAGLMDRARFGPAYDALIERALEAEAPAERLAYAARIARQIYDAERAEMEVLRGAGALSPEIALIEREKEGARREAQGPLLELLARRKLLRRGLDVEAARDILWTLTGREVYRMLVLERGWSSDRYEAWLVRLIPAELLADDAAAAGPGATQGKRAKGSGATPQATKRARGSAPRNKRG